MEQLKILYREERAGIHYLDVITYNKFHYWYERAKETFSDIEVVMQERIRYFRED